MISIDNELPTLPHPRTRKLRFWSFNWPDIIWTSVVGCIALFVGFTLGGFSFLNLYLLGFGLVWWWTMNVGARSKYNDRRYKFPFHKASDFYRRIIRKGVHWKVSKKEEAAMKAREGTRQKRDFRVVKPFPLEVKEFRLEDGTSYGLVYNQDKQTFSLRFTADGSRIPALSRREQYYEIKRVAELIGKATATAGIKGLNIGVGIRSRPQDQWLIPQMMLEIGDVDAVLPEAVVTNKPVEEYTLEDKQDMVLYELQNSFPQVTVSSYAVDMMVVITVKQDAVLKKSSSKKEIGEKQFKRLSIKRITDVVYPLLQKQIGEVVIDDLAKAEANLRVARDSATLYEYYEARHQSWVYEKRQEMGLEEKDASFVEVYDRYLPNENITVGYDHGNIDGTFFSVLDMTTFPADEVYAHDAPYLYDAESRYFSMSVIGRAVSSNLEYFASNTSKGLMEDVSERLGKISSGPRAERKEMEKTDRLAEMDREGLNLDFIIRFATLSDSLEDMEDDLMLDFDRFVHQGLGPHRIVGESQQLKKFLTTVTLIDCE